MQEKSMKVYYGIDRLPYKDEQRKVHYPVVGNLISGENNTTKVYFYVGLIGGVNRQWVANIKKPDGTLAYQLLTNGQSVGDDYQVVLDISSLYADQVGEVKIGVQGYDASAVIVYDEETETYEISGNPSIIATGTISVLVNYAPNVLPKGETLTPTQMQLILSALAQKVDKESTILTFDEQPQATDYEEGQVIFVEEDSKFYVNEQGSWTYLDPTNVNNLKLIYVAENRFNLPTFGNGKLVFFKDSNTLERWNATTSDFELIADFEDISDKLQSLQDQIDNLKIDSYIVVDTDDYPTLEYFLESEGEEGYLYLYPLDTTDLTKGYYRYVWENESWLALGTTEIDLTNYYTKDETYSADEIDELFEDKASKVSVSSTGTATDEINYITIDGVEKKIAGSGGTGAVSSVNGKTGDVVLDGNDIRVNGSASALLKDYLGQLREDTDGNTERIDDVEDDLDNVREVAEGKCKTYVISYNESALTEQYFLDGGIVYKTNGDIIDNWSDFNEYVQGQDIANGYFNSQNNVVDILQDYILTEEKIVILPDPADESIKTGDIILVLETNVPDRWVELGSQSIYYNKLETSKVDLTNYVDLTSAQTISGVKTIKPQLNFAREGLSSTWNILYGADGDLRISKISGGTTTTCYYITTSLTETRTTIKPLGNTLDLGTSSNKWKDLYLSGTAYLGSNLTIADLGESNTYFNAVGKTVLFYCNSVSPAGSTQDLGQSGRKWKDIYLSGSLKFAEGDLNYNNIQQKGSIQTSAEATFSGSLTSNNEYQFTTPLTSLNITSLVVASGDTMPRWELTFVVGSNFTITSLGQDISWKYGEPTFETGEEYTIYIKGNYAYLI